MRIQIKENKDDKFIDTKLESESDSELESDTELQSKLQSDSDYE